MKVQDRRNDSSGLPGKTGWLSTRLAVMLTQCIEQYIVVPLSQACHTCPSVLVHTKDVSSRVVDSAVDFRDRWEP